MGCAPRQCCVGPHPLLRLAGSFWHKVEPAPGSPIAVLLFLFVTFMALVRSVQRSPRREERKGRLARPVCPELVEGSLPALSVMEVVAHNCVVRPPAPILGAADAQSASRRPSSYLRGFVA